MKKFFLMAVLALSMSSCNYFSSESQDSNVADTTAVQEVVDTVAVDSVVVVDTVAVDSVVVADSIAE